MAEEIEIEFKSLLSKSEFDLLEKSLPFPKQPIIQTNHYFDTKNFRLKNRRCSVRIREIDNQYTFTLKQKRENHVVESNEQISFDDAQNLLQGNYCEVDDLEAILQLVDVEGSALIYYGALKTERRQFTKGNFIYFLDKSFYNGIIDYELELEAATFEKGKTEFERLIKNYHITPTQPITKIRRFFQSIT